MTAAATDSGEQCLAGPGLGGAGSLDVARRCFGRTYETCEMVEIRQTVRPRPVVRLGDGIAQVGDFIRKQAVGNPDFIQVSIARERQQARLLTLPAEPANA